MSSWWRHPARRPALLAGMSAGLLGFLLAVIAARGLGPLGVDAGVHRWVLGHRHRYLTTAAIAVTTSGTGPIAYALAALAGVLGAGRARWWRGGLAAVGALVVVQGLRVILAVWIGRDRPPVADWAWHAGGPALPSGHTSTAAVVAALFWVSLIHIRGAGRPHRLMRRLGAGVAVVWAVGVGLTRVYLGVHWPTDVVAGWLLGVTFALTVVAVTRPERAQPGSAGHSGPDRRGNDRDGDVAALQ